MAARSEFATSARRSPARPTAPWSPIQNNQRGVLLVVYKQPGANVIDTVDQIKEMLPRLIRNIPPAIDVEVMQDRTSTIRASVARRRVHLGA